MKALSVDQQMHAEKIIAGTKDLRQTITLYKKNDEGLALFRVQAFNHISCAILSKALGHKLPAPTKKWLKFWKNDAGIGQNITKLFDSIDNDF